MLLSCSLSFLLVALLLPLRTVLRRRQGSVPGASRAEAAHLRSALVCCRATERAWDLAFYGSEPVAWDAFDKNGCMLQ